MIDLMHDPVRRMLDSLASIAADATSPAQRRVLTWQADMILRHAEESVHETHDLEDIRNRYRRLAMLDGTDDGPAV